MKKEIRKSIMEGEFIEFLSKTFGRKVERIAYYWGNDELKITFKPTKKGGIPKWRVKN